MKNLLKSMMAILIITLFTACTSVPIYNVTSAKVQNPKSANDTYTAIMDAGKKLGWKFTKTKEEGKLKGVIHLRRHVAIISLNYSASDYSIKYMSSENLKYDQESQKIHKNYNSWIKNLRNEIDMNLEFN